MRKINIISSIVLLLLAGYVFNSANYLPGDNTTLGAAYFPKLVAGLLAAFAAGILVFAFRGDGREEEAPASPQKQLFVSVACLAAYVGLMPAVGFLPSTPVFLVITGLALADSARRWWKTLCLSAAITTAAVYYLFAVMLNVPLP